VIEGVERFYLEEILSEKPYIKARVQPFQDYSENSDVLDQLEQAVFDEVRTNVQVNKIELLLQNKIYGILPSSA
jgi:Lon protease-like protein